MTVKKPEWRDGPELSDDEFEALTRQYYEGLCNSIEAYDEVMYGPMLLAASNFLIALGDAGEEDLDSLAISFVMLCKEVKERQNAGDASASTD